MYVLVVHVLKKGFEGQMTAQRVVPKWMFNYAFVRKLSRTCCVYEDETQFMGNNGNEPAFRIPLTFSDLLK